MRNCDAVMEISRSQHQSAGPNRSTLMQVEADRDGRALGELMNGEVFEYTDSDFEGDYLRHHAEYGPFMSATSSL